MALEQETRDELLMLSAALTASLTALAVSKQLNPGLNGLMQRYGQVISKAEQELSRRSEPVLSARPSKFVKDISFPLIVCLCGWSRVSKISLADLVAQNDGKILLVSHERDDFSQERIDLADEVLILNPDGEVFEQTKRALAYALAKNKRVRFLEPERGQVYLTLHQQELQDLGRRC